MAFIPKVTIGGGGTIGGTIAAPQVAVGTAANTIGGFAPFTYDDLAQILYVPAVLATTIAGNPTLYITGLGDVIVQPAGSIQLNPGTVVRINTLTSDGFVKTSAGNGTLTVDTTAYQPAGSYLTGTLTTGRVALSVTATSVTDDAGFTYDAGTNIATATGAFLSPLFYDPVNAVTLRSAGGNVLVETTAVGSTVTVQAPDGSVALACNTNVTGPTILLTRNAGGGGYVDYTQRIVVASAAGAILDSTDWNAATVTITGNTNITTAGGFNLMVIRQPTYYASNVLTVSKAATLVIEAGPVAGINAVITKAYALWVKADDCRFDGNLITGTDDTYHLGASGDAWSVLWVTTIAKASVLGTITMQVPGGAIDGIFVDSNSTGVFSVTHQSTNGRFISDTTGIAFFHNPGAASPTVAQQTVGANVNNVGSSGTTGQFDDFTNGTVYATDYANLHNTVYQLCRSVAQLTVAMRNYKLGA